MKRVQFVVQVKLGGEPYSNPYGFRPLLIPALPGYGAPDDPKEVKVWEGQRSAARSDPSPSHLLALAVRSDHLLSVIGRCRRRRRQRSLLKFVFV